MAPPLIFKTNKTMAIKKTTAVKKSDPPKKIRGQAPDAPRAEMFFRAGKYFAKIPPAGKKDDTHYYTFEKGKGSAGYANYTANKPKPKLEVYAGGSANPIFDPAKVRGFGVSYDKKGERTLTPPYMMQEQAAIKAAKDRQKAKMKAAQMVQRQSASGKKTTAPAKKK